MLLEIRALSPICKGEQIYIDYLQDIQPRVERQSILADRYFFTCACSRGCSETLNSEKAFDAGINYKSFDVLNRLIDSMLQTNSSNIDAPFNKTSSDINWSQLYRFYKQRLRLQVCWKNHQLKSVIFLVNTALLYSANYRKLTTKRLDITLVFPSTIASFCVLF